MDRAKLTKSKVDDVKKPASGEVRLWDKELRGFCVRVYASDRRVYAVKYRVGSRQRWYTIGEHGKPFRVDGRGEPESLTAELARKEAERVIGAARDNRDLSTERLEHRRAPTVGDLIDLYLEEGPKTVEKRASAWATDKANLNHHVRPLIGNLRVRELSRNDIAVMVADIAAGKTAKAVVKTKLRGRARVRGGEGIARRVKAAASAMFSWGVNRGIGRDNPARAIKLPKRPAKERFLSKDERAALLAKLDELEAAKACNAAHAAIIRLLLFTGARKGEVEGLAWSEVDLEAKRITLPPDRSKTGGKTGERRIALNSAAVTILKTWRGEKAARGLVFPATRGKGHTTGVQKTWETVRKAAGLPDVRLHDLRHTWASVAVADGASLYLVGKALGHTDHRTTQRYAHVSDDPLQELAEATGKTISGDQEP